MTPAAIAKIIDSAALDVFGEAAETGQRLELDTPHLLAAVERYGGQDRPTVEHWTWESLILPGELKGQLQQLQAVIEDPESAVPTVIPEIAPVDTEPVDVMLLIVVLLI